MDEQITYTLHSIDSNTLYVVKAPSEPDAYDILADYLGIDTDSFIINEALSIN